jgi:hypothetical protein
MTSREEASGLVQRMLECFNTRQFDNVDDLYDAGFVTRPFGTGSAEGKKAWRQLVTRYPSIKLIADDILVDGDKVTARSSITGIGTPPGDPHPILIEIFRIEAGRLAEWWGSTWHPDLSQD